MTTPATTPATTSGPITLAPTTLPAVVPTEMPEMAKMSDDIITIIPFCICICTDATFEEAKLAGFSEIYIPRPGGKFMKHQKLGGGTDRHVRMEVSGINVPAMVKSKAPAVVVNEVVPAIHFFPAGKPPAKMFLQIVQFFKAVMEKYKSDYEAQAFILWSQERGYYISIPEQTVSKASVNFEYTPEVIPAGSVLVVDIHSHNTMSAFFSGTDDRSDLKGIYYSGVVGHLDKKDYANVFRFNFKEEKISCKLEDVFSADGAAEVDPAWLAQVKQPTYQYGGTGNYGGYRGPGKPNPTSHMHGRGGSHIGQGFDYDWNEAFNTEVGSHQGNLPLRNKPEGHSGTFDANSPRFDSRSNGAGGHPALTRRECRRLESQRLLNQGFHGRHQADDDGVLRSLGGDFVPGPLDEEDLNQMLGKSQANSLASLAGNQSVGTRSLGAGDGFDYIAAQHGVDTANAWKDIMDNLLQMGGHDELMINVARLAVMKMDGEYLVAKGIVMPSLPANSAVPDDETLDDSQVAFLTAMYGADMTDIYTDIVENLQELESADEVLDDVRMAFLEEVVNVKQPVWPYSKEAQQDVPQ